MGLGKLPEAPGADEDDSGAMFSEINITPLTDVILVLLIIVMASATTAVAETRREKRQLSSAQRSGIQVKLPDGSAKELDLQARRMVVTILESGALAVNGQATAPDDLDELFQRSFAADRDTMVVLKADGRVAHKSVVDVMERAKRVGLRRLAIATKAAE